jgi:DNA-binding CsgD family transcriptional regulator
MAGPEIDAVARVLHVAHVAEVYFRLGGARAVVDEVRRRQSKHFDPVAASQVLSAAPELLRGLDAPSVWDAFLEEEPAPLGRIGPADLPALARAFAQFADLKSVYTLGHSTGVAELAAVVARVAGLSAAEGDILVSAALVHDVGRVAVANGIWDKPGPLNTAEWERVRAHSAETERVLGRAEILRPLIDVAGSAHERLDGSGYHRRLPGAGVGRLARMLAACDAYGAMTEERAHRPARGRVEAAKLLGEEARAGRLDREATRLVLEAAGQRAPSLRRELPDGLSEREGDVLCLLARGLSNKEIGGRLHISSRTVQTHVMHIFDKTGIRGRAAAALYAVDQGLIKNPPFGG